MDDSMKAHLRGLFEMCLFADYVLVENAGNVALQRDRDVLYVLFEKSSGAEDWENNLDFGAVTYSTGGADAVAPYKNMEDGWYCHGGFLRVWQSVLPYINNALLSRSFREIITVGYSHGAALAVLCHEHIWYYRNDIRANIFGYGFGCPRVIWGKVARERERWKNFYVVRNFDDIVTHLPPRVFGFGHVGKLITVGGSGRYSRIDAHRAENYIKELSKKR